ncbi:MAG: prepilin-type cleavage/methylation domain-containing protein [Desulfitobacteriia bacterium]|jgi:type II secretory pathway pseudopilin PulG
MGITAKNPGYTLLEILLVLTIVVGLGMTLLISKPVNVDKRNLSIAATELAENLREIQQAALADNVWYKTKFYFYAGEYRIYKQNSLVRTVKLPERVSFGDIPPELIFTTSGAPNVGMTIRLRAGKLERKVIVAPVMGRIRIEGE